MTSREKVEAWYLENWGHTEDDHETLFERDPDSTEEYYRLGVRLAWESWQAASEASEQKLEESRREFRAADTTIHNLELKITDMAVQLANSESKCRELAAENAGLKNFIINDCHVAHIEPETFYEEEITRYVSADGYEPETPASDAFLAEVRAQGVEMFAKNAEGAEQGNGLMKAIARRAAKFADQLRKGAAL
ncbi:hypothetical protein [Citrobacter freundii]|uniref:hypothetical protein n=1 Tax=Citrobacter freundii TaxID=546 RepID=UPI0019063C10|nr:hypothetical protein [Citrobacter freundii]MBJ9035579.1 hypothetical protein [Citrobacter freundii]